MADFVVPVRVAPVIKFSRWALLITGIFYGAYHHRRFSRKEAALREIEERERPAREAKMAMEKKIAFEADMKYLESVMAPSPKP